MFPLTGLCSVVENNCPSTMVSLFGQEELLCSLFAIKHEINTFFQCLATDLYPFSKYVWQ